MGLINSCVSDRQHTSSKVKLFSKTGTGLY